MALDVRQGVDHVDDLGHVLLLVQVEQLEKVRLDGRGLQTMLAAVRDLRTRVVRLGAAPARTLGRPTLLQAAAKLLKLSECRRFSGSFCGPRGASSAYTGAVVSAQVGGGTPPPG